MKNYLLANAVLAGLMLSVTPVAMADGDFSIGVAATRAAVDVNKDGLDVSGDATGYRLFGSYMFNKNLGIEAGISSLGEPNDSTIPSNMHVETQVYDVYAVGKYYASEKLSFFGKAGFASSRTESEIGDDDETETNHSSTDFALGLGGQYDISERFGIRTEMEWLDGKAAGLERVLSLSGVMRFGK